jgi:hypothetical protein
MVAVPALRRLHGDSGWAMAVPDVRAFASFLIVRKLRIVWALRGRLLARPME